MRAHTPYRFGGAQETHKHLHNELNFLKRMRNELIRNLWDILNNISTLQGLEMTDEDLNLWVKITNHSAIQSRLDKVNKGKEKQNG